MLDTMLRTKRIVVSKAATVLPALMLYIAQSSSETDVGQANTTKCDECKGVIKKTLRD